MTSSFHQATPVVSTGRSGADDLDDSSTQVDESTNQEDDSKEIARLIKNFTLLTRSAAKCCSCDAAGSEPCNECQALHKLVANNAQLILKEDSRGARIVQRLYAAVCTSFSSEEDKRKLYSTCIADILVSNLVWPATLKFGLKSSILKTLDYKWDLDWLEHHFRLYDKTVRAEINASLLWHLANNGRVKELRAALDAGADPHSDAEDDTTVLAIALRPNSENQVDAKTSAEMVEHLLASELLNANEAFVDFCCHFLARKEEEGEQGYLRSQQVSLALLNSARFRHVFQQGDADDEQGGFLARAYSSECATTTPPLSWLLPSLLQSVPNLRLPLEDQALDRLHCDRVQPHGAA